MWTARFAKSTTNAYLSRMFRAFEFCLPTPGKVVPAGPEWFHEIKYDGYRLRVERDGERVRLITRGGYDPLDDGMPGG
jgi:ATP-dependent DNA ligase